MPGVMLYLPGEPMPNDRYAAISGQQFIGGQRRAEGEASLCSLRADDGQPTGYRFHQATAAETAAAAEAAAAAFAPYSQLSAEQRANFLDAIAEELDALDDVFFTFAMQETALPSARLSGERARTSGQMRLFATLLRRGDVEGVRIDCALPQRSPCRAPICVNTARRSARWRSSAPATSRWRFPPRAVIPPPRSPPVARSCSRRTAAI